MQHLDCLSLRRRAKTHLGSGVLSILTVLTFAFMHAVVAFAGATCCIDEAIERADECEDQAQADSIAEAKGCKGRILPHRIAQCLQDVYDRHQDRKAECRETRDREIAECNI